MTSFKYLNTPFLQRQYEDGVDRNSVNTKQDLILANIQTPGELFCTLLRKKYLCLLINLGNMMYFFINRYKTLLVTEIIYINVWPYSFTYFPLAISSLFAWKHEYLVEEFVKGGVNTPSSTSNPLLLLTCPPARTEDQFLLISVVRQISSHIVCSPILNWDSGSLHSWIGYGNIY